MSTSASSNTHSITPESPWLGLRSFNESAQAFFFGREEEVKDLFERIVDRPLTVLFGQSGLGKSSLLQAALMPRLRGAGYLPLFIRLDHDGGAASLERQLAEGLGDALGEAGFQGLAARLREIMAGLGISDPRAALWLALHDPQYGLTARSDGAGTPRPVLLIDQFEEVFTLGDRPARREHSESFRETLAVLVENWPPAAIERLIEADDELASRLDYRAQPVRVLLSLREDFLHLLERWRRSVPSIMENRVELRMLSGPKALQAVLQPGRLRRGMPPIIPDQVGDAIVRFVAGAEPGVPIAEIDAVPPLLSLVCAELNSQRVAAGDQQVSQAQFEGHSTDILSSFYARSFELGTYGGTVTGVAGAGEALKALRLLVEDRLLSADGFRESIALGTITRDLSKAAPPDAAKTVLDALVERRLLTVEERGGVRRIELAHDVLTGIVKTSRDERQELEAVLRAREEKDRAEAEAARTVRERNRLRRYAILATLLSVVACAGVIVAAVALREARRQEELASLEAEKKEQQRQQAETALIDLDKSRKESQIVWEEFDKAASIAKEDQIRHMKGLSNTDQRLAEIRVQGLGRLFAMESPDPTVGPRLARAHYMFGCIGGHIGDKKEAVANLRIAASMYADLEKAEPSRGYRIPRCQALDEAGYVLFVAGEYGESRPLYEEALKLEEETAAQRPDDPAIRYQLAQTLVRCGSVLDRVTEAGRRAETWSRAKAIFDGLLAAGYRRADCLIGRMLANYKAFHDSPEWNNRTIEKEMLEGLLRDAAEADKLKPGSPIIGFFQVLATAERAEAIALSMSPKDAQGPYVEAATIARNLAQENPNDPRYATLLANTLGQQALNLQRVGKWAESKSVHEQSIRIASAIVAAHPDRPAWTEELVKRHSALAEFCNLADRKIDPSDRAQELLAASEACVTAAREGVHRFPDSLSINKALAKALMARGTVETDAKRFDTALPYINEMIGVYQTHVLPNEVSPEAAGEVLPTLETASEVLVATKSFDKLMELGALAQELAPRAGRGEKDSACGILRAVSNHQQASGETDAAITTLRKILEIAEPELEHNPWHWYLRSRVTGAYMQLAQIYQGRNEPENEVLSLRGELRVWHLEYTAVRAQQFLEPGRPTDADEAAKIREEIKLGAKGMKRFTVPCDFNGIRYPFNIYISDVKWPKDALEDQAMWLKTERGGVIPKEVMESFQKLHKIAYENSVSFQDLCVYALGTAETGAGKTVDVEVAESIRANAAEQASARIALKTRRVVELRAEVDKGHSDAASLLALALAYEDVGTASLAVSSWDDAISSLENAVRVLEQVLDQEPTRADARVAQARMLKEDAEALLSAGKKDQALLRQLKAVEIAESLWRVATRPEQDAADARRAGLWTLLGDIYRSLDERDMAARSYLKATDAGDDEAAKKYASMAAADKKLLALGSDDVRAAFGAADVGRRSLELPLQFANGLKELRAAALDRQATAQSRAAQQMQDQGRTEDAIATLLEVWTLRAQQAKYVPRDPKLSESRGTVAFALTKLYDQKDDAEEAAKWIKIAFELGSEQAALLWVEWLGSGKCGEKNPAVIKEITIEAHKRRAARLYDAKDFEAALADYRAIVELAPDSKLAYHRSAMCLSKLGRWEESVQQYQRSIAADESDTDEVLKLIEALVISGRHEQVQGLIEGLDRNVWFPTPPLTPEQDGRLIMLRGLAAIAERVGAADNMSPGPHEKALREMIAASGARSELWNWEEMNRWLTSSSFPHQKADVVRELIELIKGKEGAANSTDKMRTIVLVYGMMDHGGPFWVYVAVKPSRYQDFKAAQANGTLDLYHFGDFGEIIVSGEGRMPPDEVTLKVAEMYRTKPEEIFRSMREGRPQDLFDDALHMLETAEKKQVAEPTGNNREALASALNEAAYRALFVRRWGDAEAWARRCVELNEKSAPFANESLAIALLYSGRYEDSMAIFRAQWKQKLGGRVFAEAASEDFAALEKAGVTHPDLSRLMTELGPPPKTDEKLPQSPQGESVTEPKPPR